MVKIAAYLLVGLAIGLAVASMTGPSESMSEFPAASSDSLENRIASMEAALSEERSDRLRLEQQLTAIEGLLDEFITQAPGYGAPDQPDLIERASESGQEPARGQVDFGPRGGGGEAQIERFIAAGIPAERAQWIVQRTSELRMEALEARYAAIRDGESPGGRNGIDTSQILRAELGDRVYEQYLEALGRPTRVGIGSVLASSPAERAGIQAGDQLVTYAGQRVFDLNELTQLTFEGQPGESVVVDVLRDGQQIQLYLPRGPIGITGSRRFRRPQ